jgi:heat-inducible transcriptional repressor
VPTDDGYRVYVDSLLEPETLRRRDAEAIESELARDAAPRALLDAASRLLSRLSGNVGFVLAPHLDGATFRHIDLVRLPHPRVLVVMVARTGLVTSKVIEVEEELGPDELLACANYLNHHFAGLTLAGIRAQLLELMRREQALYDALLKRVLAVGRQAFAPAEEGGDVILGGASNVLRIPEFGDLQRMRTLLSTLEEKGRLVRILNACLSGNGVRIVIGHEMPDPDLSELALVAARYPVDGDSVWGLGVVGCPRMAYGRVIALVDHMARAVSRTLRSLEA